MKMERWVIFVRGKQVNKIRMCSSDAYTTWQSHPSSLTGRQKNVMPEKPLHEQVDKKLLRQLTFHGHNHCIHMENQVII